MKMLSIEHGTATIRVHADDCLILAEACEKAARHDLVTNLRIPPRSDSE